MKDIDYWNKFYNKTNLILEPSNFCIFVLDFFKDFKIEKIMDAGCGNGRDSFKLCEKYNVIGLDSSKFLLDDCKNFKFICDDFVEYKKKNFDMIYSRFTFHSLTNEQQIKFVSSIEKGTYLCIETRSDKSIDEKRHFGDGHFRNLTNFDHLKKLLTDNNFNILFMIESKNLALYKDENPYCIRVICKKINKI
jgi:SAM-dependent methyltransferase